MELINILYQPYVICIIIAIIITLITYFILKKYQKKDENDKNKNCTIILLNTFIGSFLGLMLLKNIMDYANKHNFFQKGGDFKSQCKDNLTIIADDIEIGVI